MCGVSRKDRCRNSDVRARCGLKEDVVTRAERVSHPDDSDQLQRTRRRCARPLLHPEIGVRERASANRAVAVGVASRAYSRFQYSENLKTCGPSAARAQSDSGQLRDLTESSRRGRSLPAVKPHTKTKYNRLSRNITCEGEIEGIFCPANTSVVGDQIFPHLIEIVVPHLIPEPSLDLSRFRFWSLNDSALNAKAKWCTVWRTDYERGTWFEAIKIMKDYYLVRYEQGNVYSMICMV
ncbi:hypothetical protein EVAR_27141_1 [Eumeta japonica]|uniref:Uncharacterized protein n=1 Tax=Eumeta variegata TaxID=151549 RepID=A0A4C1VYU3_EUMVA|nr:hypothetical protein EVAR_27141_1 [Eumeta japonica]